MSDFDSKLKQFEAEDKAELEKEEKLKRENPYAYALDTAAGVLKDAHMTLEDASGKKLSKDQLAAIESAIGAVVGITQEIQETFSDLGE